MMSMIPARRRLPAAGPVESSEDLEPVEPKDHDRIPAAEPVNLEPKDDDRLTKREDFLKLSSEPGPCPTCKDVPCATCGIAKTTKDEVDSWLNADGIVNL